MRATLDQHRSERRHVEHRSERVENNHLTSRHANLHANHTVTIDLEQNLSSCCCNPPPVESRAAPPKILATSWTAMWAGMCRVREAESET